MRKGIMIMESEKYDCQKIFQKILEKKISQTLCTSSTIWCKNILPDFLCQIKTQRRHITHVLSHICLSKSTVVVVLLVDNYYERKRTHF